MGALGSDLGIGCNFSKNEYFELYKQLMKGRGEDTGDETVDGEGWIDYMDAIFPLDGFRCNWIIGKLGTSVLMTVANGLVGINTKSDSSNHYQNVGWSGCTLNNLIANKENIQEKFNDLAKKYKINLPDIGVYSVTFFDC